MSAEPDKLPTEPKEAFDAVPTLQYGHKPGSPPGSGRRVGMFIGGLFAGLSVSAAAYAIAFGVFKQWGLIMIPVVVVGKIYWERQLKQSKPWEGFGSGLITSIGLIVLLVGACFGLLAASFSHH